MRKAVYYIMISKIFFGSHPRKGQPTGFVEKIILKEKIHTIRENYDLWKERIDKVNAGKAVLQLRVWTGAPYRSKQETLFELTQAGIQKLDRSLGWFIDDIDSDVKSSDIAKNDGLALEDFANWFNRDQYDTVLAESMAIIHFTDFRYKNSETA